MAIWLRIMCFKFPRKPFLATLMQRQKRSAWKDLKHIKNEVAALHINNRIKLNTWISTEGLKAKDSLQCTRQ